MKMHKLEVYVIDFEGFGADEFKTILSQLDEGNASFRVVSTATADIGEWDDDHELNMRGATAEQFGKYFK